MNNFGKHCEEQFIDINNIANIFRVYFIEG